MMSNNTHSLHNNNIITFIAPFASSFVRSLVLMLSVHMIAHLLFIYE